MTAADLHRLVAEQIPLARLLHLQIDEVSPGIARLLLRFDPTLLNHTGALHAGAMFAAAETATLLLGHTLLPTTEVLCQSKAAELRFRKAARTDLWATAQPAPGSDGDPAELLARLTAEGKLDVEALVELCDLAGDRVAEGTITLTLRRL